MKEATGNLWEQPHFAVVVITTNGAVKKNGACVMGRGCAQEARDEFPGIDMKLGGYINQYGNRPFNLGQWQGYNQSRMYRVVSMPTKHRWDQQADPSLIRQSAHQLMEMADRFHWNDIVLPRPGCGNGGLSWPDVKAILEPILDDRFTVITFPPKE